MIASADLHLEPGPSLSAIDFDKSHDHGPKRLLDAAQRRQLAALAVLVDVPARTIIYRANAEALSIFFANAGVLKSFRELPSGKRRITAFLFAGDVFGLAQNGRYVNTIQAVTKASLYRMALSDLRDVLRRDPHLQFPLLCKAIHELREGQHHAILLGRRDAAGRLAMFLHMLERNSLNGDPHRTIDLPMSRTDVAEYLGLSLESVSRAASALVRRGIVSFQGGHAATIVDRAQFEKLVRAL